MRVINQHFLNTRNVGDLASAPSLYFSFPGHDVELADVHDQVDLLQESAVIYGGGSLGKRLLRQRARNRPKYGIAWGVGTSWHGRGEPGPRAPWLGLYGSREFGQPGAEWVPCASCMSPLFDERYDTVRHVGFYYNADPRVGRDRAHAPDLGEVESSSNEVSFRAAVEFLGGCEVVVTNSYHGVYWAQLLGRAVVVAGPYSSKFFGFRHPPLYSGVSDWRAAVWYARPCVGDLLGEAREASVNFHARVLELLG